jgi:hypothetical protein
MVVDEDDARPREPEGAEAIGQLAGELDPGGTRSDRDCGAGSLADLAGQPREMGGQSHRLGGGVDRVRVRDEAGQRRPAKAAAGSEDEQVVGKRARACSRANATLRPIGSIAIASPRTKRTPAASSIGASGWRTSERSVS